MNKLHDVNMQAVRDLVDAMATGRDFDGECRPFRNERIVQEFVNLHVKCTGEKPTTLPLSIIDMLDFG